AQGLVVHSATKPHLVRYNERIRLAGKLIEDRLLAELLKEVLDASEDLGPSFFEVTTAATFLAFARVPADACVIEVGLGGRFDATNVMEHPVACGIASLGIDHEAFLLSPDPRAPDHPLARIAFEKAHIVRKGAPLVTMSYPPEATAQIVKLAHAAGAQVAMRGQEWTVTADTMLHYRDAAGELTLPLPRLYGAHQAENAALAVAMLRHQATVKVTPEAMAEGIRSARWPARLQALAEGPITALVPDAEFILDGGHNPDAAQAIARALADRSGLSMVMGMMANRPIGEFLEPLAPLVSRLRAVPIPGHECHSPEDICRAARKLGIADATPATDIVDALGTLAGAETLLIAGSLYLAGVVLEANGEIPD
ncbi:MAG: folylpolyglutamate synthase, partial [Proteobacteria bacterium]|nr:folylpolyglutamate synthase [Pseudomonadota bacterium]